MYIVYYCVYCDHFGVVIGCCVSELYAKLCPHRNVCHEIVYCCFYQIIFDSEKFITMFIVVCSLKSVCIPCFCCCVSELRGHLCSYCNVWPEAVFYKNYTVY